MPYVPDKAVEPNVSGRACCYIPATASRASVRIPLIITTAATATASTSAAANGRVARVRIHRLSGAIENLDLDRAFGDGGQIVCDRWSQNVGAGARAITVARFEE